MQASEADLVAKVTVAQGLTTGVPSEVLALTPAQWPGAHDTLSNTRSALDAARADLEAPRADAEAIVTILTSSDR